MSITLSFSTDASGLGDLNTFLESRSYFVGFCPTQNDVAVANALKGVHVDASQFPHVARYVSHIHSFSADCQAKFCPGLSSVAVGGACATTCTKTVACPKGAATAAAPKAAAAPAPKPAAAAKPEESGSESEDDMFGSDDEDKKDKKAKAAAAAKAKATAAASGGAKKKEAVIERTQCVYEVKPAEAGQDMADLERRVRTIEKEGLTWGERFKVVDVAYGIQKLVIQFLVDDRCGLQEVEDAITDFGEELVSSVDLCSMNRL